MSTISNLLEAILFYKSEPLTIKELAKITQKTEDEVGTGLTELRASLTERGVTLIEAGDEIALGTSPDFASFFETLEKEENETPLTKAALETLAIILYKNKISKPQLDTIRGVNSQFIIRNLLVRGLIAKEVNPKDNRTSLYTPTTELFSFLGISKNSDLPDYAENVHKLHLIETEFSPSNG
jgi:segregation and condensation protein B